jgi:hypothetical protein
MLSAMRLDVAAESEGFFAKEAGHSGTRWGYTPWQKVSPSRSVSSRVKSGTHRHPSCCGLDMDDTNFFPARMEEFYGD